MEKKNWRLRRNNTPKTKPNTWRKRLSSVDRLNTDINVIIFHKLNFWFSGYVCIFFLHFFAFYIAMMSFIFHYMFVMHFPIRFWLVFLFIQFFSHNFCWYFFLRFWFRNLERRQLKTCPEYSVSKWNVLILWMWTLLVTFYFSTPGVMLFKSMHTKFSLSLSLSTLTIYEWRKHISNYFKYH